MPSQLAQPNDHVTAMPVPLGLELALLHRHHGDLVSVYVNERQASPKRSFMSDGLERAERLVERRGLPWNPTPGPVLLVTADRIPETVRPKVPLLVGATGAVVLRRGVDQCQTQLVVRRFVPAVLAVVQDRHAVRAIPICQIDPLMPGHLVLVVVGPSSVAPVLAVRSFDHSPPEVVRRFLVRDAERERRLEQCLVFVPIDPGVDLDRLSRQPARVQPDRLLIGGVL